MNHFYRTIWSQASNSFVAVPENTASRGKRGSSKTAITRSVAAALLMMSANAAFADAASGIVLTGTNTVNATAAFGANTIIDGNSGTGYFVQSGSLTISMRPCKTSPLRAGQGAAAAQAWVARFS